ncbi:hypothetical protein FA95DRAFT_1170490 [Auriscalpium vulgare]|uniref:Uncharacterized protein n=1 Tax=Auriscalpium vulgare TaxID=40419 RepID=A0ACB8SAE6_9AGAM|nr:hypothetical protein FA95DRAFT_1170490 [Auriscalpium vulgare]
MILQKPDELTEPLLRLDDPDAGPSDEPPPPSFEESASHVLIDFDQGGALVPSGGEAPPPQFEPYNAEHWVSSDQSSIISHDPHLNKDGEALYRFLLSQARTPPTYIVHIQGVHVERRSRLVTTKDRHGHSRTETEYYNETVTDFDFKIDLSQHVPSYATQWTVGDDEPTYRGKMKCEIGLPGATRKPEKAEARVFDSWQLERVKRGLPPWIGLQQSIVHGDNRVAMQERHEVLKSSWTLRQWADDYCGSNKVFKEFVYEKVVYGWSTEALENAILTLVRTTHYTGDVTVNFRPSHNKIIIRPDTHLSRMLSNGWWKFFLIITLIYPFIWLFQHFHSRGGGRWTVGGGAYALKSWEIPTEADNHERNIVQTEAGPRKLVGIKEGQWFKAWEGTIRSSVLAKKIDPVPAYAPASLTHSITASMLDGYRA